MNHVNDRTECFEILPGAGASPVILHVPHSSRVIPESVRRAIPWDDRTLERELDHLTDSHTAAIAEAAAAGSAVTPWRFVNGLSRLVVDPERFPDEREEMLAVGMGAEKAFSGFGGTGLDSPFAGTYVPLRYYGKDGRVGALMVEIRRDTYMAEPGGPAGPGLVVLAAALTELVDALLT